MYDTSLQKYRKYLLRYISVSAKRRIFEKKVSVKTMHCRTFADNVFISLLLFI